MNRHDTDGFGQGEAVLEYGPVEYRIVRPGSFVRCAVTGVAIPLDGLRYWSVDLQEAYASPDAVLMRRGLKLGAGDA
ncbi:DUF2093 domain-containing protein [Chelatococcus reniformis]|uniref:DUF2093 domain-containing protein n=1 Tax=Chelatococcus reniformis TaxID=1494448 RepID=A0A916XEH2_9HYPH|nr:DUF2093 domain-containing protein [Chelatococcus reniformis]GGC67568.1 hypothetical protein GCM10010994_27700 [Chelatococcus reniformis]